MTIKRQILNFNQRSVDVRIGSEIMDELPRLVTAPVGKPRRALLVADAGAYEARGAEARRSLIDAGFSVEEYVLSAELHGARPTQFDAARPVFQALARAGLTADDLVFSFGSYAVCSLAAFCARLWRGGTACALMPDSLEGMVSLATALLPLGVDGAEDAISLQADPSMVLCDLALLPAMPRTKLLPGLVLMAGAALAEGKKTWSDLREQAGAVAAGEEPAVKDALAAAQIARRNVVKSPNPSARRALDFGHTTARALASCAVGEVSRHVLLAEGMRFEARLAVDAAGLDPEVAFALDDLLFDLGVEDPAFTIDASAFAAAVRAAVRERSNRFLLPLPKAVGMIRLTSVDDALLERHAAAYAASLA